MKKQSIKFIMFPWHNFRDIKKGGSEKSFQASFSFTFLRKMVI